MGLASDTPCSGLTDGKPQQERSYHMMADLCLPHPSDRELTTEHETLALLLQKDLQMLHNRNLRGKYTKACVLHSSILRRV